MPRRNSASVEHSFQSAQSFARHTALERQDLSRTYLAHHELESVILIFIIRASPCGICCGLVLLAAELVIVAVHHHAVSVQLITHQPTD